MEQNKEERGLSILDIFHAVKRHIIGIFVIIFVCCGLGAGYVKFINPESYKASTHVYVSYTGENDNASGTEGLNYGRLAPKTFVDALNKDDNIWVLIEEKAEEIIKVDDAFEGTIREENFFEKTFTYKTIGKGLEASCSSDLNSYIFNFSFTHEDKTLVAPVMEATIEVLYKITDKTSTDKRFELFRYFTVSHLGEGDFDSSDCLVVKTSSKKLLVLSAAVGFVLAAAYVFIFELLDQKITSRKAIEEICDLKIIGLIPDLEEAQNRGGRLYGKKKK